jgi:hypothetical protein
MKDKYKGRLSYTLELVLYLNSKIEINQGPVLK